MRVRVQPILLGAALLPLALSGAAYSAPGNAPMRVAVSGGDLDLAIVEQLADLAEWCNKKKLFARRDHLYASILSFDTDHRDARWHLRYRRDKDGAWQRESEYRVPKDRSGKTGEKHLRTYEERMDVLATELRAKTAELVAIGTGDASNLWRTLLRVFPEDAVIHAELREKRWDLGRNGHVWISEAVEASLLRRASLRGVLAEEPDPSFDERVSVVGVGDCAVEVDRCRDALAAMEALGREVAGLPLLPRGLVVHLVGGMTAWREYVQSIGLPRAEVTRAFNYSSYWMPGTWKLYVACDEPQERLDRAVLQALASQLVLAHDLDRDSGWAFQGLCLYFTEEVLRSPTAFPVAGSSADARSVLPRGPDFRSLGVDWLAKAGDGALSDLLSERTSGLDYGELAASALLVRYLVESCPDQVVPLLAQIAKNEDGWAAVERSLQTKPSELAGTVAGWGGEVLSVERGTQDPRPGSSTSEASSGE